jgi:hypothetical protein
MKIRIYVLCYSDETYINAIKLYGDKEWAKVVFIKSTVLFESIMYDSWLEENYDDWKDFDYVGTISWKAYMKIRMPDIDKLSLFLDNNKNNYDVAGFYFIDMNMIDRTNYYHPKFRTLWIKILSKLGYSMEQILNPNIKGFYCNYWITSPKLMMDYINFFKKVKDVINNYKDIQDDLWSNSNFQSTTLLTPEQCLEKFGIPHYPYHPFIYERMPCIYFEYTSKILITQKFPELY